MVSYRMRVGMMSRNETSRLNPTGPACRFIDVLASDNNVECYVVAK